MNVQSFRNEFGPDAVQVNMNVLGIIGAGKLGTTIGRAASDAGWQVLLHDSAADDMMTLVVETLVPGARLVPLAELVAEADVVMLALPFAVSDRLDYSLLDDKVVLDPMNFWEPTDGHVAALDGWTGSTSDLVAARNPRMRLVKSLNHLGYHDYTSDARSPAVPSRRAVAVASDDEAAGRLVARLVDDIGFDPVIVPFDRARLLDTGGPVFGIWLDRETLRRALAV